MTKDFPAGLTATTKIDGDDTVGKSNEASTKLCIEDSFTRTSGPASGRSPSLAISTSEPSLSFLDSTSSSASGDGQDENSAPLQPIQTDHKEQSSPHIKSEVKQGKVTFGAPTSTREHRAPPSPESANRTSVLKETYKTSVIQVISPGESGASELPHSTKPVKNSVPRSPRLQSVYDRMQEKRRESSRSRAEREEKKRLYGTGEGRSASALPPKRDESDTKFQQVKVRSASQPRPHNRTALHVTTSTRGANGEQVEMQDVLTGYDNIIDQLLEQNGKLKGATNDDRSAVTIDSTIIKRKLQELREQRERSLSQPRAATAARKDRDRSEKATVRVRKTPTSLPGPTTQSIRRVREPPRPEDLSRSRQQARQTPSPPVKRQLTRAASERLRQPTLDVHRQSSPDRFGRRLAPERSPDIRQSPQRSPQRSPEVRRIPSTVVTSPLSHHPGKQSGTSPKSKISRQQWRIQSPTRTSQGQGSSLSPRASRITVLTDAHRLEPTESVRSPGYSGKTSPKATVQKLSPTKSSSIRRPFLDQQPRFPSPSQRQSPQTQVFPHQPSSPHRVAYRSPLRQRELLSRGLKEPYSRTVSPQRRLLGSRPTSPQHRYLSPSKHRNTETAQHETRRQLYGDVLISRRQPHQMQNISNEVDYETACFQHLQSTNKTDVILSPTTASPSRRQAADNAALTQADRYASPDRRLATEGPLTMEKMEEMLSSPERTLLRLPSPERHRRVTEEEERAKELREQFDMARLTSQAIRSSQASLSLELQRFKKKLHKHTASKHGERVIMEACRDGLGDFNHRLAQQPRRVGNEGEGELVDAKGHQNEQGPSSNFDEEDAWGTFEDVRGMMISNLKLMHDAQDAIRQERVRMGIESLTTVESQTSELTDTHYKEPTRTNRQHDQQWHIHRR